MTNLDGWLSRFPSWMEFFGVGGLATSLKALADTEQIGPWHIGQWIDFKILQSECDSAPMRMMSARDGGGGEIGTVPEALQVGQTWLACIPAESGRPNSARAHTRVGAPSVGCMSMARRS
jgi:hypothetical protein